jgi:hypothetical protein
VIRRGRRASQQNAATHSDLAVLFDVDDEVTCGSVFERRDR